MFQDKTGLAFQQQLFAVICIQSYAYFQLTTDKNGFFPKN
jgi:hypothetical protein